MLSFERVIHSVLTARIIMALRGMGMHSWDEDTTRVDSTVGTVELVNRHRAKDTESTLLASRGDVA